MAKKSNDTDSLIEEPGKGHNSISKEELVKIIEHVERLLEERKNISESITDAMAVAKSKGFDKRTIREVIKIRALDKEVRDERQELLDIYLVAIGLA